MAAANAEHDPPGVRVDALKVQILPGRDEPVESDSISTVGCICLSTSRNLL